MQLPLKSQSFNAIRWLSFAISIRVMLQLLQVAFLARILAPTDFGLMAIVISLTSILNLFSDLGLGKAIIHHQNISASQLSSLYWLNFSAALLLMGLMMIAAPFATWLYADPRLLPLLLAASLIFPITAIGHQLRMQAEKQLRFAALAAVEISAAISGFLCALSVALFGGGVWALLAGMLFSATSTALLSWRWLAAGWRPAWHLSVQECRTFLNFGGFAMGETLANTLRMQSDVLLGGLFLGSANLGFYSLPRDLSLRIAFVINPIITRVGFPVMARVQGDVVRLKSIYLQTLRMTASVNFPLYLALALYAEDIVVIVFGADWHPAGDYLRLFALTGLLRSTGNPSGSLVYAVGRARRAFWWNLSLLVIVPWIFLIGVWLGGAKGLAWSFLLTQLGIFIPAWRVLIYPLCGARFSEFLGALWPPLLIAAVAGSVAYGVSYDIEQSGLRVLSGLLIGAFVYLVLSIFFNRVWVAAMRDLLVVKEKWGAGPMFPAQRDR
ncbi:MOP flippase family protein [Thiorhodovibrio frisius]|uniref:Membrane protein involved in the export of O-antigen and teichoic acid n=1 Tax=Thiorhodovibrio frisius TaxID=631362 RepID=H8Z0R7_9GAMM|nr:MOP flippase family protein [Thiorhodovibrio frisius]EIC21299.1 membrane protein involved in the export of O-antigen and teichoic acid [Thiorhodovibrio frisius]WPL23881.1 Teichuronic acid biosynthesis protein TuaB [Thiorhodovibrio frisius]